MRAIFHIILYDMAVALYGRFNCCSRLYFNNFFTILTMILIYKYTYFSIPPPHNGRKQRFSLSRRISLGVSSSHLNEHFRRKTVNKKKKKNSFHVRVARILRDTDVPDISDVTTKFRFFFFPHSLVREIC